MNITHYVHSCIIISNDIFLVTVLLTEAQLHTRESIKLTHLRLGYNNNLPRVKVKNL